MLLDDTPLPLDAGTLQNALDALGCVESSWITTDPLLDLWIQDSNQYPDTFVPVEDSLFGLNEADMLQEYHIDVNICRMLISDSLYQRQKPSLIAAAISNPHILSQEVFHPTTINMTELCTTSLIPTLTWNPTLDFVPPLPPNITPSVATKNLPFNLLTMVPPSSAVSTVSVNYIYTTQQTLDKILPDQLIWMALLLCYPTLADGKNTSPFNSAVPPIHYMPQYASILLPPNAYILYPLHETFDALLHSKNIPEAITSMSHRF